MSVWKPIETAPRDGTQILICKAYDGAGHIMHPTARGIYTQRAAWWPDEEGSEGAWVVYNSSMSEQEVFFEPTHWTEIPPWDMGEKQ